VRHEVGTNTARLFLGPRAIGYHGRNVTKLGLDKYGGWQSRDTARAFGEYSGYVAEHLGDRIKH